ncbi:hypothetical protein E2C01_017262 [Portunus trituberculatus]|uniref:Uncharacterized protein n=1 Tax=Portunus trituberculatus TaxID=210409 RepID=A0A5B7DTA4_PORTR|nr:hypothetical protein [Portunus trituberculatus]
MMLSRVEKWFFNTSVQHCVHHEAQNHIGQKFSWTVTSFDDLPPPPPAILFYINHHQPSVTERIQPRATKY